MNILNDPESAVFEMCWLSLSHGLSITEVSTFPGYSEEMCAHRWLSKSEGAIDVINKTTCMYIFAKRRITAV